MAEVKDITPPGSEYQQFSCIMIVGNISTKKYKALMGKGSMEGIKNEDLLRRWIENAIVNNFSDITGDGKRPQEGKLYVLTSGGDWVDASCEHYILTTDIPVKELEKMYDEQGRYRVLGLFYREWLMKNGYVRELEEDEYEWSDDE